MFLSLFQNLESTEFTDVRPLFPPLMHTVCLVYSHSEYYNTAARIIVLMEVNCTISFTSLRKLLQFQEVCNLLIHMARKYLDPSSIFQIEVSWWHEACFRTRMSRRLRRQRTRLKSPRMFWKNSKAVSRSTSLSWAPISLGKRNQKLGIFR